MSWRCPRCAVPLVDLAIEAGVSVGCPSCGGVWLDDAAFALVQERVFARILERSPGSLPAERCERQPLACPECAHQMVKTELAGVKLDHCSRDGTWFDPGELESICQAIAASRARAIVGDAYAPQATPSLIPSLPVSSGELERSIDRLTLLTYLDAELTRRR